ncbi:MAG: hypothetical protein QF925_09440 [Dehalococcoidia bacterium]|jgi:hypothetical protein|nr:hypothetical protein [Dehalococcoidia bacterium]
MYTLAKLMGDYNAVKKGKVGKRVGRRVAGKATGKAMRSCSSRLKVTAVGDLSQRPINGFCGLTS